LEENTIDAWRKILANLNLVLNIPESPAKLLLKSFWVLLGSFENCSLNDKDFVLTNKRTSSESRHQVNCLCFFDSCFILKISQFVQTVSFIWFLHALFSVLEIKIESVKDNKTRVVISFTILLSNPVDGIT
jgi:hypothetical protein